MADDERRDQRTEKARENEHEPDPVPVLDDEVLDDEVLAAAVERFPEAVAYESKGQAVVCLSPAQWGDFAAWLRDEQQFETCLDVCGVDHLLNRKRPVPAGVTPQRFEVVANFMSRGRGGRRLRAICQVPAAEPSVPSITNTYPGADWPERETYDLFGIVFEGHPDLTRILLPDDWQGWPLRKDDAAARVPVAFKGTKTRPFQQARGPVGPEGGEPSQARGSRRPSPGGER